MNTPSATDLMLDDLARRVAQTSVEAAQWRARAIAAEAALAEIQKASEESGAEPESEEEGQE